MQVLKAGFVYFLMVFGAGFALAFIRIPFLLPAFGERTAELIEMPLMVAVILLASMRLVRRHPAFSRRARLFAGLSAFAWMVSAELLVAYAVSERSPVAYIASRDPVSGGVYLVALVFFAVAPCVWRHSGSERRGEARDG